MQEGTIGSQMPVSPSTSLLCENPRLAIEVCTTLNPATLLPVRNGRATARLCRSAQLRGLQPAILVRPSHKRPGSGAACRWKQLYQLTRGKASRGCSGDSNGDCRGAASTPGASVQLAELTRALELSEGQRANSVTDSCFFFLPCKSMGTKYTRKEGSSQPGVRTSSTQEKSSSC